jgi:uncharacterized protein
VPRPIPVPDADSAPFWAACREHRLTAQQCNSCGKRRWPPAEVCPHCRKLGATWVDVRGTGTITSFVVQHQVMHPAFADAVPYTVAFVSLDEAPEDLLLLSNVIDTPWQDIRVGMRVEVAFDDSTEGVSLPLFRVMPRERP